VIIIDGVIKSLDDIFKKFPPLPANARETLFKIAPYLALIFGILGILAALSGLGLLTAFAPLAVMGGTKGYGIAYVSAIGLAISSVMMLIAYPGLKAGKIGGWNLLFYSEIVNIVASVLSISIGSMITAVIAFYILFQIKAKYK